MAKKPGTPALRAERVWQAIEGGTLKVAKVHGTRILRILKAKRLHLTWRENGRKKTTHVTLPEGWYLNPRWTLLTSSEEFAEVSQIDDETLRAKGMLRVNDQIWVLIYQQVEDIFHLKRQLKKHILPQYSQELQELHGLMDELENRALASAVAGEILLGESELLKILKAREQKIGVIRPRIAARGEAVDFSLQQLATLQARIRRSLENMLDQPAFTQPEATVTENQALGMAQYLRRLYPQLEELKQRPLVTQTKWAQYFIKRAMAEILLRNWVVGKVYLDKAVKNLQWLEGGDL